MQASVGWGNVKQPVRRGCAASANVSIRVKPKEMPASGHYVSMTRWLALAGLCTTGIAAAQPVTRPDACRVTIAYAPEDVRAEIEAWVRAEPRCERELEVRVVPTDDGLYLQARDGAGRVRERVVPDPQSAAVLVVSWMADDSLGPTHAPSRLEPPVAIGDDEMPVDLEAPSLVATASPHARGQRWLTLGALGSKESGGVRGQIDLYGGKRWSIGIGGGWRGDHHGDDRVAQARVLFSTGRTFGRIAVRLQLGVGADLGAPERERMELADTMASGGHDRRDGIAPRAEAGVLAKVPITGGWGLVGGPLAEKGKHQDKPVLSIFLGVQRGL